MSQPQPPPDPEDQRGPQQDPHLPPAGWYPDPSGQQVLRWWTGMRWGQHTQPLPGGPPGAPPPPPGASPVAVTPAPRPRSRRKVVIGILGVVAAAVILAVIDLALNHAGSAVGSSSTCTSNSCIAKDAKQSLTGAVAKDESVITGLSCDQSTVKNPSSGVYTVSCTATYSDGSRWGGIASVLISQNRATWEPTAAA